MNVASPSPACRGPTLEEIYLEHATFCWRTVRYLGVPAADAEDVVHEVFIIVQRRLSEFDPNYPMKSWIAGITRRVVMHHHRGTSRRDHRHAKVESPNDDLPAPDEIVAQRQAAALLQSFLDSLEPEKREVFVLGELEGFAGAEIAEVVGRNVNTIYSCLRTVRQAFQKWVARHEAVRRREGG